MSGRGGRDRFRRDYAVPPAQSPSSSSARFSDRSRPSNPPSRNLWVGSLSEQVTELFLANLFLRFGELEHLAYQPGRSYAFVNFRREEDAIAAKDALRGYNVGGATLKIEFAKADKLPTSQRDDKYLHRRDDQRSVNRNSPFSQRESRTNHGDPDASLPENSRVNDNTSESPSEVLWIGFPTFLRIDEAALRKAFSPFGEIEKITVFQGRNYAFVRFRSLTSACRAKETLQGKLFGNPRVHICFARSDTSLSNTGRRNTRTNSPPSFRPNGRAGSSDDFRQDRNFRTSDDFRQDRNFRTSDEEIYTRATKMLPEVEYRDPDVMGKGRRDSLRAGASSAYDQRRTYEMGHSEDLQGYRNGPSRDDPQFREFSPPKISQRSSYLEEPWDLPEDPHLYRESKRFRTAPPENELPEYPFSELDRGRHSFGQVVSDFPRHEAERIPDHPVKLNRPFPERNDMIMGTLESFQSALGNFSANIIDQKRITPDLPQPSMNKEWEWEGTIAKGGNAVCRARCFPVGKVLDIELPQLLDCTARTGLDMLAKHYYQASGTWVVFFVPHSDADMSYYNEFMNYLGEKQRAAVAKLDEKNTLFLVPPSDFSEKVLKVPGKLSISGVVLRLEPPTSNLRPPPPPQERGDTNSMPSHSNILHTNSEQHSGLAFPPAFSSPTIAKPSFSNTLAPLPRLSSYNNTRVPNTSEGVREYPPNHHSAGLQSNPSSHFNSVSGPSNPVNQDYNSGLQRSGQDTNFNAHYNGNIAPAAFQQDQLAQLAALLGQQQRQPEERLSGLMGQPETPQRYAPAPPSQAPPGFSGAAQFQHPQQQQHQQQHQQLQQQLQGGSNVAAAHGAQEAVDGDPQKRLQATLQLAAALLQQIQEGKGT